MAENINFISANELPNTEANEVDVLCVENGEMKLKREYKLGGKECDMRIRYNFTDSTYELIDGTYQQVVSKINNDAYPTIYVIKEYSTNKYVELATASYYHASNMLGIHAEGLYFSVYSDNSIVLAD